MLNAITRAAREVDRKLAEHNSTRGPGQPSLTVAQFFDHLATPADLAVSVTEQDFQVAKTALVPSVSVDELAHYERVRHAFEGTASAPSDQNRTRPGAVQRQDTAMRLSLPKSTASSGNGGKSQTNISNNHAHQQKPRRHGSVASQRTKGSDKSTFYFENRANDGDSDEDEYVVRTDHLRRQNGSPVQDKLWPLSPQLHPIENGKGKRKGADMERFGSATNGDEDLYR